MRAITLHQEPAPLLVGERVNSQGSRKVKRLLLADDYEGILEVAREQVDSGAHVLDVCVALTERGDEAEQMSKVVKLLSMSVETPLMIDSTEADVIEAALEHIPGRAIINSINMENGRKRIDAVVPLAKKHGAALVALTIDAVGMAKTRERKLEVARAIYDIVVGEYGLAPEDLIYDALTFTLATGDAEWIDSAHETIEGIRLIKRELPGVFTILGVSNVSFGLTLEARSVLNSVFLHHCVEAGLDAAIVNPAHITPYAEISAQRSARWRTTWCSTAAGRAAAVHRVFLERSEPQTTHRCAEKGGSDRRHDARGAGPLDGPAPEEGGDRGALDAAGVRENPVRVLNEVLLPAMKEVGDKFGAGELILPFVLQSAEVMKKAVKHLEQFLEKAEGYTKGKVVLATVYGDVHDIGKSLVNTILSNNGYTVFDLGKQVPVNTIIEKALEVGADAIGLCALLVARASRCRCACRSSTSAASRSPCSSAARRSTAASAGARCSSKASARTTRACSTARTRSRGWRRWTRSRTRSAAKSSSPSNLETARADVFLKTHVGKDISSGDEGGERSDVAANNPVPAPPFWGTSVLRDIPLDEVFDLLDLDELYRLQWGARGSGEQYKKTIKEEFEPALERLKQDAQANGWIKPQAVYGYFPAQSIGNDIVIYDPAAYSSDGGSLREIARFHFPRMEGRERLCLADYFRSASRATSTSLHSRSSRWARRPRTLRRAPGRRRIHRGVLLARPRCRSSGSSRRMDAPPHQERARHHWRAQVRRRTSGQAASATHGDTAHVRTSRITPLCSSSCPPRKRSEWISLSRSSSFRSRARPRSSSIIRRRSTTPCAE